MPNWTTNEIEVTGDPDEIDRLLAAVGDERNALDFERIIPMPAVLKNTVSGPSKASDGTPSDTLFEETDADGKVTYRVPTPEEQKAIDAAGAIDWYEWQTENWGVKWGATGVELELDDDHRWACFHFETAWSAPVPVFKKLREMFPMLEFKFGWQYEDDAKIWPHTM